MIDVLDTCCALKSLIVLVSHAGHIGHFTINDDLDTGLSSVHDVLYIVSSALKSLIVLVSHAGHIWTLLLNAQRLFLIFLWKNKVSTCPR